MEIPRKPHIHAYVCVFMSKMYCVSKCDASNPMSIF